MYHISTQGVDEHMINGYYCYYYLHKSGHYFVRSGNKRSTTIDEN